MGSEVHLPSVEAVLDRARQRIPRTALGQLVMNDPGHGGYVAAYARVLADPVALREPDDDGVPLLASFEITENLVVSHALAGASLVHRWFSVLTACIELLGAGDVRGIRLSATLGALLADAFALEAEGAEGSPVDLLPAVCRDLARSAHPHDQAIALLARLIVSNLHEAEIEAMCRELHAWDARFQAYYLPDGEESPLYAERPEFVLGAVVDEAALPTWIELVDRRFPRAPAVATETRERLLREGRAWLHGAARRT